MKKLIYKSGAILATIHLSSIQKAHGIEIGSLQLQKSSMGLSQSLSAKDKEQADLYDVATDSSLNENSQDSLLTDLNPDLRSSASQTSQ